MRIRLLVFLLLSASLMSGCGYHQIQADDEQVVASASEFIALSRRRADQVPNLIQVVHTYAPNEREALSRVKVAQDSVAEHTPTKADSSNGRDAMREFSDGNMQLSQAIERLLAVAENYPALKADANFRDIEAQMEGAETHLDAARGRYADAVAAYNAAIGTFPGRVTALLMGAKPRDALR
ncbi:LemA family protein [Zoogloea sp. LCSB751]|uniref:LemA family protein n=1 Tax=Zoogloea sp. LCSB751 TaxID=1965277 RepID=UPI0009A494EB|nr:LemA family protein [Zoogloea sp. LCSB751]